jgi:hypothetical protein
VRVVSLHCSWLGGPQRQQLLPVVARCDDPLAIVLAAPFDPLTAVDAVMGLKELVDVGMAGGRYLELLRTDLAAIPFAALGGRLGCVGLSTSTRHHGLPFSPSQRRSHEKRQSWPLVFVPRLVSWQRGNVLGALEPWDGSGLTDCDCWHCAGRSLLRFDGEWPDRPPADLLEDAREHDLASWTGLARRVLADDDPFGAWLAACRTALHQAAQVLARTKVKVEPSTAIRRWAAVPG